VRLRKASKAFSNDESLSITVSSNNDDNARSDRLDSELAFDRGLGASHLACNSILLESKLPSDNEGLAEAAAPVPVFRLVNFSSSEADADEEAPPEEGPDWNDSKLLSESLSHSASCIMRLSMASKCMRRNVSVLRCSSSPFAKARRVTRSKSDSSASNDTMELSGLDNNELPGDSERGRLERREAGVETGEDAAEEEEPTFEEGERNDGLADV
jgi:hypothetical protein